ncbi:hypothetical protein AMATHDRAFT_69234 [Amanita thiersii Skay4041]|uniref:Uncharacterized protein n=1 Tax=Amanita thiersii Skay4041 TaxID=703135 RepID=A0A2A9N9L2_9AGAR|nr:hypothetical protein AMATHDRAFT_69234 [Amanita thiersii Skay4041]
MNRDDYNQRSRPSNHSSIQSNYYVSPRSSPSPNHTDNAMYSNDSDYYVHNQLQTYTFGTAPRLTNSPPTRSGNLTSPQDDPDQDDPYLRADITPRPSVVAYSQHPPSRDPDRLPSHISAALAASQGPSTSATHPASSRRYYEPSSASESVISLHGVEERRRIFYTGSGASVDTSSTSQTYSNEFTSSSDDDDPNHSLYTNTDDPFPNSSANISTTSMEFSSEEEDEFDYMDEIEISSVRMGSRNFSSSEDIDRIIYYHADNDYRANEILEGRRGSLPMAIPGAMPFPMQHSPGRGQEDTLISLRRPSRSLDDDLRTVDSLTGPSTMSRVKSDGPTATQSLITSPISVPGSERDWRNLTERAKQLDKGKGRDMGSSSTTAADDDEDVAGEFDLDWEKLREGIVTFESKNVAGFVATPVTTARPSGGSRWFPRFGGNNNQNTRDARRPSIVSVASSVGSSLAADPLTGAIYGWGGEVYKAQRRNWTFKREKIDGITRHGSNNSSHAASRGFASFLSSRSSEEDKRKSSKDREKERERMVKAAATWKGMQIDSQEIWKIDLIGRFRVERKATKTIDIAKGPQQRIIVHHIRDSNNTGPAGVFIGPVSTVHKHSKAVAFSIGRFYRKKSESKEKVREAAGPLITASHPPAPSADSQKRPGGMILLAPRRVQVAFTNTTSTRKLESHGLLDDDHPRTSSRETDHERSRKERERRKGKEKERDHKQKRSKTKERETESSEKERKKSSSTKHGGSSAVPDLGIVTLVETSKFTNSSSSSADSYQASSAGTSTTVVASTLSPTTPSLPPTDVIIESLHHLPPIDFFDPSIVPITTNIPIDRQYMRRRRRRIVDPLEVDDYEEDYDEYDNEYGRYSPPTRTPHSEAFGTVDASIIEQLRLERAQHEAEGSTGLFMRLFRNRHSRPTVGPIAGQLEANYNPPWIVLPSRNRQEQQQRVVENLNSSFMDVGLLPTIRKPKYHTSSGHSKKHNEQSNGILSKVPEESLYMLLPLWPGETDPVTGRDYPAGKRTPPTDRRQYLLVYYAPTDKKDQANESKKRSRLSPTSSHDAARNDRSILLTSFHISARFVAHKQLIGTGIRVPDEGLTVCGPLDYAWETLPSDDIREENDLDYVIGICYSRHSGIEFIPEGFDTLGLCLTSTKPPRAVNDNVIPPEPVHHLTPIGRAVLEMAWLGSMALTSFGQVGST